MIERHYRSAEAADLLGIHHETLRRYAQAGRIESVRIGTNRVYPESALQAFLDEHREPARVVSLTARRQNRASTTRRTV